MSGQVKLVYGGLVCRAGSMKQSGIRQLDHMLTICTLLYINTLSLNFYRPDVLPDAQPTVSKHVSTFLVVLKRLKKFSPTFLHL